MSLSRTCSRASPRPWPKWSASAAARHAWAVVGAVVGKGLKGYFARMFGKSWEVSEVKKETIYVYLVGSSTFYAFVVCILDCFQGEGRMGPMMVWKPSPRCRHVAPGVRGGLRVGCKWLGLGQEDLTSRDTGSAFRWIESESTCQHFEHWKSSSWRTSHLRLNRFCLNSLASLRLCRKHCLSTHCGDVERRGRWSRRCPNPTGQSAWIGHLWVGRWPCLLVFLFC